MSEEIASAMLIETPIRRYQPSDLDDVMAIFVESIRRIAVRDYNPAQIEAWTRVDRADMAASRLRRPTWVATRSGIVIGFTDLESDGDIDMMYVHPNYQRTGIAKALLVVVEDAARQLALKRIFTKASITARPFFESQGFRVTTPQIVESRGEIFANVRMEKSLTVDLFTCKELDRDTATEALKIWREVSTWLIERDIPLWDPLTFDEAFIDRTFATGHIIGVRFRCELIGVAVVQWSDDEWWPDRSGAALYLHKIAVSRASAGSGALEALLEECERMARSRKATFMRLDAAADRPKVHNLYERLGFTPLDTRTVGSFTGIRFEKELTG